MRLISLIRRGPGPFLALALIMAAAPLALAQDNGDIAPRLQQHCVAEQGQDKAEYCSCVIDHLQGVLSQEDLNLFLDVLDAEARGETNQEALTEIEEQLEQALEQAEDKCEK